MYSYLNVIFGVVFGILIWSEYPDTYTIIGAILILSSRLFLSIKPRKGFFSRL